MTADETHVPYPVVLRAPDLDWVKFDAELSRDGSVDPVDKALYAALASYADTAERNTAQDPDDEDVPTRRRLAACIGRSVKTVDRATVRLEEIGLIEVERRRDPENPRSNLPSTYRLLDRERWDERAGERAAKRRAEREKKRAAKEAKGRAEREAAEREAAEQRAEAADSSANTPEEGWPHVCGHPGDTSVPTPGDTSVATLGAPVSPPWGHQCRGTSPLGEESSSSEGCGENSTQEPTPNHGDRAEEEDDAPSAKKQRRTGAGVTLVQEMTDATAEEAQAVIARLRAESKRLTGRDIGSVRRYIDAFEPEDLTPHLGAVRAQSASEARTRASERRPARCGLHLTNPVPCQACRTDLNMGGDDAEDVLEYYAASLPRPA